MSKCLTPSYNNQLLGPKTKEKAEKILLQIKTMPEQMENMLMRIFLEKVSDAFETKDSEVPSLSLLKKEILAIPNLLDGFQMFRQECQDYHDLLKTKLDNIFQIKDKATMLLNFNSTIHGEVLPWLEKMEKKVNTTVEEVLIKVEVKFPNLFSQDGDIDSEKTLDQDNNNSNQTLSVNKEKAQKILLQIQTIPKQAENMLIKMFLDAPEAFASFTTKDSQALSFNQLKKEVLEISGLLDGFQTLKKQCDDYHDQLKAKLDNIFQIKDQAKMTARFNSIIKDEVFSWLNLMKEKTTIISNELLDKVAVKFPEFFEDEASEKELSTDTEKTKEKASAQDNTNATQNPSLETQPNPEPDVNLGGETNNEDFS